MYWIKDFYKRIWIYGWYHIKYCAGYPLVYGHHYATCQSLVAPHDALIGNRCLVWKTLVILIATLLPTYISSSRLDGAYKPKQVGPSFVYIVTPYWYQTQNHYLNQSQLLGKIAHTYLKLLVVCSTMKTTARHFRWPCANTVVFKIRITILKSMPYVAFLWDFSQLTSNHQSNTKNNI